MPPFRSEHASGTVTGPVVEIAIGHVSKVREVLDAVGIACGAVPASTTQSGREVVALLYPPFEMGIPVPMDANVTLLPQLGVVGLQWGVVPPLLTAPVGSTITTSARADDAKGSPCNIFAPKPAKITATAALDDPIAIKIDQAARQVARDLRGPSGLLKRHAIANYYSTSSVREFRSMLTHLPYKLLHTLTTAAVKEDWYGLLDSDVLNQALLREEWGIRAAFLRGGMSDIEQLVPLYNVQSGILSVGSSVPRSLTAHELRHPRINPKEDAASYLPLEPNIESFQVAFDRFSNGILDGVWHGHDDASVFCAGGAVLGCFG